MGYDAYFPSYAKLYLSPSFPTAGDGTGVLPSSVSPCAAPGWPLSGDHDLSQEEAPGETESLVLRTRMQGILSGR